VAVQVVAGLIYRGNRLLACQRREQGAFPLKWEFPGGKVETGEECFDALQRELREELGIEIHSATEIARYSHSYPDRFEVELVFFRVRDFLGGVKNLSFHRLLWAKPEKLKELDFLEGDLPLIDKLLVGRGTPE
jgi:8-oxo-dGTP diphosphatase